MGVAGSIRALSGSPIAKRLLTTTLWSAVGDLMSKGAMLLSLVLAARILGKGAYGEFGLVRSTISTFATFGGVGLGLTANKFVARFRDADKPYSGQIIGSSYVLAASFGGLIGLAVFASAGYLVRVMLDAPQLEGALRIAAFLLFLGSINGAQLGILQGLEAYRRLAVGAAVQGTAALVFIVLGSWYFGLDGALAGLLIYTLGGAVIFQGLIYRETRQQGIRISYHSLDKIWPIFWSFSVPAALMGIAVAPFKWLAEVTLAKHSGFQNLGVFHASMTIANIILALVSTLNAPLISLVANLPDAKASSRVLYVNLYGSWYVFLLLATPLVIFPELPGLLFGARYQSPELQAASLLLILYCGLLVYYQGIMRFVTQHGTMWFGLFTNLCEGATLIVAFHYLGKYAAVGLGLAYISSYVVRVLVTTPVLLTKKIVSPALIFDKYFIGTLLLFVALVALRIGYTP